MSHRTHLVRTLSTLTIAAAAASTLVACDHGAHVASMTGVTTPTSDAAPSIDAATAVRSAIADAAISATVNAEFARDRELRALDIDVDTSAGRVALKGSAPNAEARDRAARLARTVDGVVEVDNQIDVHG